MAEPENHTIRLLKEIRHQGEATQKELGELRTETRRGFEDIGDRLKNLQQAMIGESVLGRYTVAEVEERLDAIEKRLAALEKRR